MAFSTKYKLAHYLTRCVRDTWVKNKQLVFTIPDALDSNVAIEGVLGTYDPATVFGAYLSFILVNCCLVGKELFSATGSPPFSFLYTDFNDYSYVGTSARKLGLAWPKVAGPKPVLA